MKSDQLIVWAADNCTQPAIALQLYFSQTNKPKQIQQIDALPMTAAFSFFTVTWFLLSLLIDCGFQLIANLFHFVSNTDICKIS